MTDNPPRYLNPTLYQCPPETVDCVPPEVAVCLDLQRGAIRHLLQPAMYPIFPDISFPSLCSSLILSCFILCFHFYHIFVPFIIFISLYYISYYILLILWWW